MKNQAQLIAYVDRIPGGTFRDLRHLLDGPLAGVFGFEPLPAGYFLFLTCTTLTYLVLVEVAKRYLLGGARKYRHRVPIAELTSCGSPVLRPPAHRRTVHS